MVNVLKINLKIIYEIFLSNLNNVSKYDRYVMTWFISDGKIETISDIKELMLLKQKSEIVLQHHIISRNFGNRFIEPLV